MTDSDYRRQRDDDQTNNDLTKKLVVCEGVVSWMKTKWKDVSVGSILKIRVGTVGMIKMSMFSLYSNWLKI